VDYAAQPVKAASSQPRELIDDRSTAKYV
jgi:hypothetical protein